MTQMNLRLGILSLSLFGFCHSSAIDSFQIDASSYNSVRGRFYFRAPGSNDPIDWENSVLAIVNRSPDEIDGSGGSNSGTADVQFQLKESSLKVGVQKLSFKFGFQIAPSIPSGIRWTNSFRSSLDPAIPRDQAFLVLFEWKKDSKHGQLDRSAFPRLFVPLSEKLSIGEGSGEKFVIGKLFEAVAMSQNDQASAICHWLNLCLQSERISREDLIGRVSYLRRVALGSSLPIGTSFGDTAIKASKETKPEKRIYLQLYGAIYGSNLDFSPFLQSLHDPQNNSDPEMLRDILGSGLNYPIMSTADGLRKASTGKTQFATIYLQLINRDKVFSLSDRAALLQMTYQMQSKSDRLRTYLTMASGLPSELMADFPEGLMPRGKSDDSTVNEDAFVQRWEDYLGLPHRDKP